MSNVEEAAKIQIGSVQSIDLWKAGTHNYKGFNCPWFQPKELLDALQSFEVRDDDIFVITYPKSGTHWINEIVSLVMNNGDETKIDRTKMATGLDTVFCPSPEMVKSTIPGYKQMEGWESPRMMLSHIMEEFSPPQMWSKKAKIIYFARNAKDLVVSYFQFSKESLPLELQNFEAFLSYFFSDEVIMGTWFHHVKGYWQHKDDPNLLFMKYEDCHKDLRKSVIMVADFLGKKLSDEEIDLIVLQSTMKGMKASYEKIEEKYQDVGKVCTRLFGQTPYLRKGQVGGWKNIFTVAQNEKFDKLYAEKMRDTDLTFDFELL